MLKKIIKKDNNEELEKILEKKDIDEQAKNLLQGILYKIEVSYNDYQKAKGIEQTQEQYVEQLLTNIKKKCNKIRVVRISQKFDEEQIQKQLKNKKYYVGEQEIISYSIEQKILYAIEKQANNKKILNNKYGEITIAVSDFINMGKDIDRVEVLRDFNGWSWTTIKKEIENIDANLIYQLLQILFGKEFLDNWCRDKDGIIDYFEVLTEEGGSKYGNEKVESIKDLLIKIAIFNDVKENEEFAKEISQTIKKLEEEIENYNDTETYIEKITNQKKQAMKKLKDIEKILGQEARLKAEYKRRNEEAPLEQKIFNIRVLKQELNRQKQKILNEINEYNYLLNPTNYIEEKNAKIRKKELLEVCNINQEQREQLLIEFIEIFLQCLNIQIKKTTEKEKIVKLIYKFRYFMCLPFNLEKNIKDIKQLEKSILKTEKILVKKVIEKSIISNVPFEVMKHVFKTRIIVLENLYYKITIEADKYYIQIFDENVSEEKFEIKQIEKTKKNKKIKIFI